MKNTRKGIIFAVSMMVLFLTFCSAVTAHPGHGNEYPEEITNDTTTSNPTPAQTVTSTDKSSSTSKSSTKKSTAPKESGQIENIGNQNTDDQVENRPVEEVTNSSNATSSTDSESSPWDIIDPILGLVGGFAVVGILFKSGLLK